MYRISKSSDLNKVIETTVVIDMAFHRIAELSLADQAVFVAWVPERDGSKTVRCFAKDGRARWARPCRRKVQYSHWGCSVCGGLGLIEDCPS
jgi:hypothetical protein